MEDSDAKVRQQLVAAADLFAAGKYTQCRKVLAQVKMAHPSIELNQMIAEYKESPSKTAAVGKKIMESLAALTPVLTPKPPRIAHQLHYWNLLVLMQLQGNFQVAELVTQEGLLFLDSLRTEVGLMLLYHMVSGRERAGRMASALALIETMEKVAHRAKELNERQQKYRFLCQIQFNRVLLKLGIIEGSKIMFMMRFNQSPQSKQEMEVSQINGIAIVVYQQLLHAEIQYHSGSHQQAMKILSELLTTVDIGKNREFVKSIIDHNMAIILTQYRKNNVAQLLLRKSLKYLSTAEDISIHNERNIMILKCKENILLAGIMSGNASYSALYEHMKSCGNTSSFKINYRKAELSIKYYHQLLSNPQRVLPSKQVHDNCELVYFYPNQPYFQQKGKNKNPIFSAGRAYYRRYVMPQWENNIIIPNQTPSVSNPKENQTEIKEKKKSSTVGKNGKAAKKEEEQKEQNNQPPQDPHKAKIAQALGTAQSYLKQALSFLQKERNIVINLKGEQKSLTHQINQKLHSQYTEYKSSILSLLCYVQLCQRQWMLALLSAANYLQFAKLHQLECRSPYHQQTYFSVLTYRMEALCELGRLSNAYEVMQDAANVVDYAESAIVQARSTTNQQMGLSYLEQMSQYGNFSYNVAVLHSRDNKIPESFQAIQKVMQQLRMVPSSPQARLPLSAIQLLTHYNLRTGNSPSAIQLIKRRRILTVPSALSQHPATLSITK